MAKYNPVRLVFNDSYGSVRWSEDFKHSDQLHKLDVLKDWVRILQHEYSVLWNERWGEEAEKKEIAIKETNGVQEIQ